jgi:hypothetical protein
MASISPSVIDAVAGKQLSAKFASFCLELHVKFRPLFQRIDAKMRKRKKSQQKRKKGLDTSAEIQALAFSQRRSRGRPLRMAHSEIVGRADNYREVFWQKRLRTNKKDPSKNKWVRDKPHAWASELVLVKNAEDAEGALASRPYHELKRLIPLILDVLNERSFPKTPKAQLDFLADSIAALGAVSPRRSRDICARERANDQRKSRHRILRHEFYVECSCGYKGPARDDTCRKCGAEIPIGALIGPFS